MCLVVIERFVDDMAPGYGFDERQRRLLLERLKKAAPPALEQHREVLEPVISDILVQYVTGEMPTPEQVAEWSEKLLPSYRELGSVWEETYQYMLPHLRPAQRSQWRRAYFVYKLGYTMGEAKLKSLAQGRFDPRELGRPWPGPHRGPGGILEEAKKAGMDPVPSPGPRSSSYRKPHAQLDSWEKHARQFIQRHQLDEGQATSVLAILRDTQEQARAYRRRHAKKLAHLDVRLREAKGEALAEVMEELDELERPLRGLFREFHARLDGLLVDSQGQPSDRNP